MSETVAIVWGGIYPCLFYPVIFYTVGEYKFTLIYMYHCTLCKYVYLLYAIFIQIFFLMLISKDMNTLIGLGNVCLIYICICNIAEWFVKHD